MGELREFEMNYFSACPHFLEIPGLFLPLIDSLVSQFFNQAFL